MRRLNRNTREPKAKAYHEIHEQGCQIEGSPEFGCRREVRLWVFLS
jgi:hypothetical protein